MKKEDQYWQKNDFLHDVVNQLPAAIFWKNTDSIFLGCNQYFAELASLSSPQEIIGKTDYDLPWNKDEADLYRKDDDEIIRSKLPKLSIEEKQTLQDGKVIFLLTNKIPLISKNKVVGILGIFHDITARKEMEEGLRQSKLCAEVANNAKTEFISNMSHDIRTPLIGIVGMSQLLEENLKNPEFKEYAHWINESGVQLLNLLNGILDVVSANHVTEHTKREDVFNLSECLRDIVQLELPTIKLKGIEFRLEIDEEIPLHVISDRTKIHRVLLNLFGNSVKFTQSGYVALVIKCISKTKRRVRLQFNVSDTGIGIPIDLQDKVFDRFFRGTPSYKGTYGGNGLGLHIAQFYVKMLGGKIKLTSQPGVGTTFYFDLSFKIPSLHIVEPNTTQVSDLKTSNNLSTPLFANHHPNITFYKPPKLLLIEDNSVAQRMLEIMANKAGCHFTSAADGEEALKIASSQPFDLILTDIGLPGISGLEFTRLFREQELLLNRTNIPIIGLTAHIWEHTKEECLQVGMTDILAKPISLATLQNFLSNYIPSELLSDTSFAKEKFFEDSLFMLSEFPLFDFQCAIQNMGNENTLSEILQLMIEQEIPKNSFHMQQAFMQGDWVCVEKIAHKMKGGAVYCGTIRMKYACLYLERYHKSGESALLERLYHQLMHVVQETKDNLQQALHTIVS